MYAIKIGQKRHKRVNEMNIEQCIINANKRVCNLSSTVIAERCEKCAEHPYGIKEAASIDPDEAIILALSGIPEKHERTKIYNGFLKRIDNFIKSLNFNTRTVIALTDDGHYYDDIAARSIMVEQIKNPKKAEEILSQYPLTTQKELLMPQYVKDIVEQVIMPRISADGGKIRLPLAQALRRVRKVNIIGFCHGGHTALKIEELMQKKMAELGYKASERRAIQKQLMILAYSPDCPLNISKSRFIAISSASDLTINHLNAVKEFAHIDFNVLDFGCLYQTNHDNDTFYCAKYNKNGVEGNPLVWTKIEVNGIDDLLKPRPKNDSISEHDFLGYEERPNMSKAAKRLQQIGKNILENSIKNSLSQEDTGFKPLPKTFKLASNKLKDYYQMFKAYRMGITFKVIIRKYGKENIMKRSWVSDIKTVSLD